ncbi:hypothetical protein GIB67_001513 [Kingdonia uniflora]|uniref:Uncharacterized protein n=1 Tax=Kingdonia uniflora TaxID=39325 RepID=A0A7J7N1Y1_9MAGN|nr:hypothetical protein GIB67_001513 [Kingdonia uniflora]
MAQKLGKSFDEWGSRSNEIALRLKFQRISNGRSNDLMTRSNDFGSVCLFLSSF